MRHHITPTPTPTPAPAPAPDEDGREQPWPESEDCGFCPGHRAGARIHPEGAHWSDCIFSSFSSVKKAPVAEEGEE